MEYKLAKKLKDAGFPQRRGCSACLQGYAFKDGFSEEKIGDDYVSDPTLDELIEGCGDEFLELGKAPKEILGDIKPNWVARKDEKIYGLGKTPRIAVANLYLALKNK